MQSVGHSTWTVPLHAQPSVPSSPQYPQPVAGPAPRSTGLSVPGDQPEQTPPGREQEARPC